MADTDRRGRRKQPRQARSKALVDAMVTATEQLLRDDERGVSMKAIARRAGVGVASVYEYFAHQDGLVDALLDRTAVGNFRRLEKLLADPGLPIRDLCEQIATTTRDIYLESPRLTRFMLKTAFRFDRMAWVQKERDRYAQILGARLQLAFPDAPPQECIDSAFAATDMFTGIVFSALYRDESDIDITAAMARMLRFFDAELTHLAALDDAHPR